jgi:type III restriction enzyme
LANKFPKDERYCHNALVFAPDKTVLQSLKEIQTFDKSKVVPKEYANWLETHLQFHFLDDSGISLNVLDRSRFNIIISNTQKIILKKQHKGKSASEMLFASEEASYKPRSFAGGFEDLYDFGESIDNEMDLLQNQRFSKLTRLEQLGIYLDEAHHAFGSKLGCDMGLQRSKTSLRITINELAAHLRDAGTRVVACYNYTGTPYVGNQLLPEVVYAYGLKEAIDNRYLKRVSIDSYTSAREKEFVKAVVTDFWGKHRGKKYEGMLPKLAVFASTIDELQQIVRPAFEEVLSELGIPTSSILVNVGDDSITSNDDLREFLRLDSEVSEKQFILLVNKGKEGWNCRSLFGVALHRKPKSRIFLLQATMRCLRAITQEQQSGSVYLSQENLTVLEEELEENFRLSIDEVRQSGKESKTIEVRLVPPPVIVKLKRIFKLYMLEERPIRKGIDLGLDKVDKERYRIIHRRYEGLDLTKRAYQEDVSYIREQRIFHEISLVAELARYLNKSPIVICQVLGSTKQGSTEIVNSINEFNELLYDYVIPRLFDEFYQLKEFKNEEEYKVELVKQPPEGAYRITPKENLTANVHDEEYSIYISKSFHVDNYCFDSGPEKQFFWAGIRDGAINKIWFTGMFTHGQSDFVISYIDPISHTVRNYYPDFLVELEGGTYVIVEIKGDNKIDDEVVLAKQKYALMMATGSGMTYRIIKGTLAGDGLKGVS